MSAGIITALRAFQEELREHQVTIWVRRAGPNYQEGLRIIRELGKEIRVPIKVPITTRRPLGLSVLLQPHILISYCRW